MSEVMGSPEQLDAYGWAVRGRAVDTDSQPYDLALSDFLSNPANDLGTGGIASLAPRVEDELGEVERIAVAAQLFGAALAAADRDAAVGVVTLDVPAALWATIQADLAGLSLTDLNADAEELMAQRLRDEQAAAEALSQIRDDLDGGWNGVRQNELESIRQQFEGLSPAALDIAIAGMTDDELAHLFDQIQEGWVKGSLNDGQREEFYLTVGMRANPQTWRRFATFTDQLDPRSKATSPTRQAAAKHPWTSTRAWPTHRAPTRR